MEDTFTLIAIVALAVIIVTGQSKLSTSGQVTSGFAVVAIVCLSLAFNFNSKQDMPMAVMMLALGVAALIGHYSLAKKAYVDD